MADESIPEEWRPVEGWPYEVSNLGRVRDKSGSIKNPTVGVNGYTVIRLSKTAYIHEMVCSAFHGSRPSPVHQVCHGNGIRTDARSENLRWGTPKENIADTIKHGTHSGGKSDEYTDDFCDRIVRRHAEMKPPGRKRIIDRALIALAEEFGVGYHTIHYALRRAKKRAAKQQEPPSSD